MKKLFALILAVLMTISVGSLVGCSPDNNEGVTITDLAGDQVTLPTEINTIATTSNSSTNMIIAFGAENVSVWCCITVYKYLSRYWFKNGLEDLKKAEWYLNKCLNINKDYGVRLPVQYKELRVTLNHHLEEWRKKNGNEEGNE